MYNPTTGFSLITFRDLWCAPFSYARIDEKHLLDRILFVRTNRGNFAKLEVTVETERLRILRCTVYTPQGIILKSSGGVRLKRGQSFDVEAGKAASRGGDLWWNKAEGGSFVVESHLSAAVHLYPGFEEVSFSSLTNSDYLKQEVELPDGERQLIYCRTNEGNYAKLLLSVRIYGLARSALLRVCGGRCTSFTRTRRSRPLPLIATGPSRRSPAVVPVSNAAHFFYHRASTLKAIEDF